MIMPLNNILPRENVPQDFRGRLFDRFFPVQSDDKGDEFLKKETLEDSGVKCSLSLKEQKRIAGALSLKMPDTIGSEADFYTIKGYGIKKMDKNSADVLKREDEALRYLASNGVLNIPRTKGIFFDDMEGCLVTDIKAGETLGGKGLSKENTENLFKIFLEMDKALFSHGDLHKGNILIDGNKVNLIDFGDYFVVCDTGDSIGADEADFRKNVALKPKKRLQKLISKAARGEKSIGPDFSDNPNLPFNTSVSNFEYRFLSPYLKEFEEADSKGAKKFFKGYLKAKAGYYKKRAEYYEEASDGFGSSLLRNYLRQAALYDMASANVLGAPNEDVIQTERLKADFKALLWEVENKGGNAGAGAEPLAAYSALMAKIDKILSESKDNDLILYAEALKRVYSNPYWMWRIENAGISGMA